MRKTVLWVIAIVVSATLFAAPEPQAARTRLADGFDIPVGKPDGEGYFIQRGFRPNGHLGEDWNGMKGGNTDLGDPVYATAHGMVVFARDVHMGWGNVVMIRHAYLDHGQVRMVDSLYGHMDRILVHEGQQIVRGQQIGTIGTNHGMYLAHLHFEIRKNIYIGINRSAFKRDFSNYYSPSQFIATHRHLEGGGRSASITINTFDTTRQFSAPVDESRERMSADKHNAIPQGNKSAPATHHKFQVDRFGDMNAL